ncbi:Flp pilus assembly protein TadB [Elusimicrobium simillimum]|uniref:hypothetical protein n=1 Tax=Elusimicrobium simillimum TaxID=3143438 RepID=UPI003C6F2BF5
MCEPVSAGIMAGSALIGAGATAYGAVEQKKAAKEASREQKRANEEAEQALKEKTPGETQKYTSTLESDRMNAVRAGYASTFKTSRQGDLAAPATTGGGMYVSGTKKTLGE